jgi:hypothetical protein
VRLDSFFLIIFCCLFLMACKQEVRHVEPLSEPPSESLPLNEAIEQLGESLADSSARFDIGRLAVADFIGPGGQITPLGEYVSDKLSVKLFSTGQFPDMMERRMLRQVLAGRKQEMTGYFDQSSVQEFGNMLGVDSMVVGTIQDLGGVYDITARIVESDTGRLQGLADVMMSRGADVDRILSRPGSANLTIHVDPAVTGRVTVAGQSIELVNGLAMAEEVPYGPASVMVTASGYETKRISLNIRASQETLTLVLKPEKLAAAFQVVPPDATLVVNGEVVQLNPQGYAQVQELQAGENSYQVLAKGFEQVSKTFNPLDQRLINIHLKARNPYYETQAKLSEKVQDTRQNMDFTIRLWTDKTDYMVGDSIRFFFQSEQDCYLNLINVSADGQTRLIFPNAFQPDNFIRGGIVHSIPRDEDVFDFQLQPPPGVDRIYAIASSQPLRVFETDFSRQAFASFGPDSATEGTMRQINVRLDQSRLSAVDEHVIRIRQGSGK